MQRCLGDSPGYKVSSHRSGRYTRISATRRGVKGFHTHPPKRLAHPRSPIPPFSTLTSRATHANSNATPLHPEHWLLCHMGLYEFEF